MPWNATRRKSALCTQPISIAIARARKFMQSAARACMNFIPIRYRDRTPLNVLLKRKISCRYSVDPGEQTHDISVSSTPLDNCMPERNGRTASTRPADRSWISSLLLSHDQRHISNLRCTRYRMRGSTFSDCCAPRHSVISF